MSITFDDGYVNFASLALPVLEDFGFHSTVFIPSGKLGHYNDWDEKSNFFHRMSIMSPEDLRTLPLHNVEIGSHGVTHIPLNLLKPHDAVREIIESRLELEERTGRRIRFFAFPFGIYPFSALTNKYRNSENPFSSYRAACSSWWGRFNTPDDTYCLRRIAVWHSDSMDDFIKKLRGDYDWLVLKESIARIYKRVRISPRHL